MASAQIPWSHNLLILDKIKNALDDDRIISFNEVEEALNDNVILSISDLKH